MCVSRLSLLVPLALTLAATGAASQTVAPTAAPNAGVATYNGRYVGPFEAIGGSGRCVTGTTHIMRITNGTITMVYNAAGSVVGTVDASGLVSGTGPNGSNLRGKVDGDTVAGETWSDQCRYKFSLKRKT